MFSSAAASAAPFELMTGVDALKYPGAARMVAPIPGPGFPWTFYDGDRLAGSADTGPGVAFQGIGTPLYPTNHVGAMSFIFRRGSVPIGGPNVVPFMGIEFLGGPRLDLDGNNSNGARSLIPVAGQTPVEIPGSFSFIDLGINVGGGTIAITDFDALGTNEAAPGLQPEIAVTVSNIAGTTPTGAKTGAINPGFDTRLGTLIPFTGNGGLTGVYRIDGLQFEFWNDSIDPNSSSANVLGTFQQFVRARGWLVLRNPNTCAFPTLNGQGLSSTRWPDVNTNSIGQSFNTANGLAGGSAAVGSGIPQDNYSIAGGGVANGNLGAYLDSVVIPNVPASSDAFVYLESAGFGINNSNDPIYSDSVQHDLVVVACQRLSAGDIDGDGDVDAADRSALIGTLLNPAAPKSAQWLRCDVNNDCRVDGDDIPPFLNNQP